MLNKNAKRKEITLVAICAITYFASYFTRKSFAAVLVAMPIDELLGGYIGMALFICYGAGQLLSGYLGDKIPPKVMLISGLAVSGVCNFLLSQANSPSLMIATWATNGLAQAMLWPPIVKILSENLTSEAFVKANLYVTAAAHISTIILYLYTPICIEFMSWQAVFYTASALALLVIPVLIFALHGAVKGNLKDSEPKDDMRLGAEGRSGYVALILKVGIVPIFIAIISMGFLRDGIETWLPTLYSGAFGREDSESVLLSVLVPVFAILMLYVTTALHKTKIFDNEVAGSLITFGVSIPAAMLMSVLIGSENAVARVGCLLLAVVIAGLMHGCNFLLISCLPGRFARYHRAATTSGICNACVYIGAAISMYGIPAVSKWLNWRGVVLSWAVVAAVGVAFCVLAIKKYSRFIRAEE